MSVEINPDRPESTTLRKVVQSVLFSIGFLGFGYALAYSSNAQFVYIKSGLLTDIHAGAYGSTLALGALAGSTLAGIFFVGQLGHKCSLILSLIIVAFGWFLHIFILLPYFDDSEAKRFALLTSARVIVGFGNGISSICVPVCVSETLPSTLRHVLGFLPPFAMNFGMFISYLVGYGVLSADYSIYQATRNFTTNPFDVKSSVYISLTWAPLTGMMLAVMALIGLMFCEDLSSSSHQPHSYDLLMEEGPSFSSMIKDKLALFKKKSIIKQFIVGFGIMFFQQTIGINAVIFNATSIFAKIFQNSNENPIIGALIGVILGSVILLSTAGTLVMGKYLRRNILIYISSAVIFFSLIILGLYFYYEWNYPMMGPIMVIIYVFVFFCSWSPVPWLVMSEIYFLDIKSIGCGFSMMVCWIFTFIVTLAYIPMVNTMNTYGVFWLYSGMTVLSVIFVFFLVPETKFKTLEEIQEIFEQ